ncbi:MAG: hypothetical protein WAW67_05980 [Candidatus Omnitrophota bacterium]
MNKKQLAVVWVILVVSFCLPRLWKNCYAEKFYSYAIYELAIKSGKLDMNIATRAPDEASCRELAYSNPKTQGEWVLLESQCVAGSELDKIRDDIFNNRPITQVYLSYVNPAGFQTRTTFAGLTGDDSPMPGFPIDIPTELIMPTIFMVKESLESQGVKNIKIIYPKRK